MTTPAPEPLCATCGHPEWHHSAIAGGSPCPCKAFTPAPPATSESLVERMERAAIDGTLRVGYSGCEKGKPATSENESLPAEYKERLLQLNDKPATSEKCGPAHVRCGGMGGCGETPKPATSEKTRANFIGHPDITRLHLFGRFIFDAFGEWPYLVGSALSRRDYRDVDVRLILPDETFAALLGDVPQSLNLKQKSLEIAFSVFGREWTGQPIDFQIQQQTAANAEHAGQRQAIGLPFAQWTTRRDP